jgi:hypothetical protein
MGHVLASAVEAAPGYEGLAARPFLQVGALDLDVPRKSNPRVAADNEQLEQSR